MPVLATLRGMRKMVQKVDVIIRGVGKRVGEHPKSVMKNKKLIDNVPKRKEEV